MRYLSDQWVEEADAALANLTPLATDLAVGFVVTGGPDGQRSYTVRLGADSVGVEQGIDAAGVTMTLDWSVATDIGQGSGSAQRAFLDGRLVIGGDVGLLLGHQKELGEIDDHLGGLRAKTDFSSHR